MKKTESRYTFASQTPKFGNVQFDSKAEYNCFLMIKKYFPLNRIKIHQPLIIRPENVWFPEQKWKIDFEITGVDELASSSLFIEYKGVIEDSFKERLKSVAHNRPGVYQDLVVVTSTQRLVTRGLLSVTVPQLEKALANKDYRSLVVNCKKERNV